MMYRQWHGKCHKAAKKMVSDLDRISRKKVK